MAGLVDQLERETGRSGTVGVAIPGSISSVTGLIKNANSVWLNGKPLDQDLSAAMRREVRCVNDANCLAVSEATDGAGAGVGGGLRRDPRHRLRRGHRVQADRRITAPTASPASGATIRSPWPSPDEFPDRPAIAASMAASKPGSPAAASKPTTNARTGTRQTGREILALSAGGDARRKPRCSAMRAASRAGLAHVINVLDPDVIVLGGGMSRIERLYPALNARPQGLCLRQGIRDADPARLARRFQRHPRRRLALAEGCTRVEVAGDRHLFAQDPARPAAARSPP